MTIESSYVPLSYAGDNITNSFPITWPYQLASQIVANYFDTATSVTTPLVYGTDFAVTPISNSPAATGTLTLLLAPLPTDTNLLITRVTDITQDTSWVANSVNPSTAFENAVDKLTMIDQENLAGAAITDAVLGEGDATYSKFLRGLGPTPNDERIWTNTLIGELGPVDIVADAQTVFEAQQDGDVAIKISGGVLGTGSVRVANDGDTNAWISEWGYDPSISAWFWKPYGGSAQGTFSDTGAIDVAGSINAGGAIQTSSSLTAGGTGTFGDVVNAPLFTGAADASLFTTGTVDTARLGSGSASTSTFLRGDSTWAVVSGGGGGINTTTTGTFVIADLGLTQTVPVTATTGIVVGTYLQIGDGTHTVIGHVTNIASLNLTVFTDSIPLGAAGNTMASGAAVQSAGVPGNNTIEISDNETSPSAVSTINLFGSSGDRPSAVTTVDMFIANLGAGSAELRGYVNSNFVISGVKAIPSATDLIARKAAASSAWSTLAPSAQGDVLHATSSSVVGFSKITASDSVTAATITPTLLNATNSQTAGYYATTNAAGQFTWVAPPAALPGGGDAGKFLNGASAFTNIMDISLNSSPTGFLLAQGTANGNFGTTFGGTVDGTATYWAMEKKAAGTWGIPTGVYTNYVIGAESGVVSIGAAWSNPDSGNRESLYAPGIVRTATGMRSLYGYGESIYTISVPAASITVDLVNGAYQRIQSISNAVLVTPADTTPLPSALRYASELTLEINAPGANAFTWAATVTWANGGSAPTLSASGVNIIRLVRRQGQTQWIGYVENQAAASPYSDTQARAAVFTSSQFVSSTTVGVNLVTGSSGSITPAIVAGSITDTHISSSAAIAPTKLSVPGSASVYLDGTGAWSTPSGGGGGGQVGIQMRLGGSTSGMPASGSVTGIGLTASTGMTITKSVVANNVTYTLSSSAGSGALPFYYVAVPSGSATTDTTNIQNAINTAGAAGGGIVMLQAGIYQINSTITLDDDNVSIIGAGSAPCDAAGGLPSTGTNLLWTGATLTGAMMLAATPGHPIGCRYEGFSLFGGSVVGTQKQCGMRFGGGSHCSIRDMAFCNFTEVALDMYSASGDPTDTIKGPNHFSIDNIHIDVGSLYWQAHSGDPLSPALAIGFRNETFDYGDFFASTINNMFIVHNYIGVWMGNSDSNTFTALHVYGYPNGTGPSTPRSPTVAAYPQPGLYITDNSRINRVIGCQSMVVAENFAAVPTAQCALYDVDFIDPGSIANTIYVGTGCEVMLTNGSSYASGTRAGTYYFGPNSGSNSGTIGGTFTGYSILFNESLGKVSITNRAGTVTSF